MSVDRRVAAFLRILFALVLLYLFLVSIKAMGVSFKMWGKEFAEKLISSCSNPFVGLFIGILATSLVQSSSTVTSLVVGFAGGGMLPLQYAIPIIMGANVGTSITNTLVSLSFVTRKEDFRRAFAGATVHDFFNISSVIVLFPVELLFRPIERSAGLLTAAFRGVGGAKFTSPLKHVIDPAVDALEHLLLDTLGTSERAAATVILVLSIIMLVVSLVYLVKTMRSLVLSRAEMVVENYLFRNDFFALMLGLGLTVLVQSSSVTTSLIVPLVGAGILSLRRCFPFTLGANLGTTCTALLASLATVTAVQGTETPNMVGVTAAFAHLCFNFFGILIFYPLRALPITMAVKLAALAAESKRWAAIFIIGVFFAFPLLIVLTVR